MRSAKKVPALQKRSQLAELQEKVINAWPFTEGVYPALKSLDDNDAHAFAISHILHHLAKTQGRLSAVVENMEHGKEMDHVLAHNELAKLLIGTPRLADFLGLDPDLLVLQAEAITKKEEKT